MSRQPDLSTSVTAGYLTGGVALTVLLHRSGHRQICHVLRSPSGFVLWVLFTLHLWSRRLDPFHAATHLVPRRNP